MPRAKANAKTGERVAEWDDRGPHAEDFGDAWEPPDPGDFPDLSEVEAFFATGGALDGEYFWEPPDGDFPDPDEGIPPELRESKPARPLVLAVTLGLDTEWDVTKPEPHWICTQFAARGPDGRNQVVVYFTHLVPDQIRVRLRRAAATIPGSHVRLEFIERTDDTDLVAAVKPELLPGVRNTDLSIFYSPKDPEHAFGRALWGKVLGTGQIRQRNALTGKVGNNRLCDVKGWAGTQSLHALARGLGIAMPEKTSMDQYKKAMWTGLLKEPETFLKYAVADAVVQLDVVERFSEYMQEVRHTLDLGPARRLAPTLGRLVANLFEEYVELRAVVSTSTLRLCMRKLGYLDPDADDYPADREARCRLLDAVRTPEALDLLGRTRSGREQLRHYHRAKYLFTCLGACGKAWWNARPLTESACLNALVQGGRCNNERPDQYRIGEGLVIDISGCYGTSLRTLTYPIGLPSCWSYNPNERRPTLGQWLAMWEKSLVPGLWTVTVSGRLSFLQDLLYSKVTKAGALRRAGPDADLSADFALLRRELKNAVIMDDLLRALRAAATNAELAELMNLEVVTALAYKAEDRVADAAEWCRAVLADPHEGAAVRYDAGTRQDTRTRAWYGLPLEGFIGRLADERTACKARAKAATTEEERARWEGLSTVLKQVINTTYGDCASRFFAMGNTVLANNITGRARLGVWMLAKALGLRQCITDGGIYEPAAVPSFRGKRPGLDTLSRMGEWKNTRSGRSYVPLPGLTWHFGMPLPGEADALALAHVNGFWAPYGLSLQFSLEHKPEHCFQAAAYTGKADYTLDLGGGRYCRRLRGKSRHDKDQGERSHPTLVLHENILAGRDVFPEDRTYQRGGILKVATWRKARDSVSGYADLKGLWPGDDLPKRTYTARYNNTHCPLDDEEMFRRRRDRKKVHRGQAVLWFERYAGLGIAAVHQKMLADDLHGGPRHDPAAGSEKGVH
jgi:hypothetical protein